MICIPKIRKNLNNFLFEYFFVKVKKMERGLQGNNSQYMEEVFVLLYNSRGGKTRMDILRALSDGPKNCYQLSQILEIGWWAVNKHLLMLLNYKLIKRIHIGKRDFYKLTALGALVIELLSVHTC